MKSLPCELCFLGARHYVQGISGVSARAVCNVSMLVLGENVVCEVSGVQSVWCLWQNITRGGSTEYVVGGALLYEVVTSTDDARRVA